MSRKPAARSSIDEVGAAAIGHVLFKRNAGVPHVARVTMSNNPGWLNALSRSMWRELRAVFEGLAKREHEAHYRYATTTEHREAAVRTFMERYR